MTRRIVEPLMFMVSRERVSCPLTVILTLRRAVFIVGATEVTVPWIIVPFLSSIETVSFEIFIRNLGEKVRSHT